jgi:ABC-type multidrug transport system fused ATPase/permease subunit
MIKKLNSLLTKRDKQFLFILLLFSIFISIIETVGISVIMPFIALASDFSQIHNNEYYKTLYQLLGFTKEVDFVIAFGVFLIFFYIFRSGINMLYFHLLSRFSFGRYHLIAYRLFENYIGMPYRHFIERNSSELTKVIINEAQHLTQLISSILFMLSEVFIIIFIYSMFIYVNWKITLLLTAILVLNALFMTKTVSKIIKRQGIKREEFQKRFYDVINSTFGNFKMIKLRGEEERIKEKFAEYSFGFARTNIINQTLAHFPRLFLEAIGFSLVSFIIIYLVFKYQSDISSAFGLLSMFVLGLYRLMPSVNRILSSYNQVLFYMKSLELIHNDLIYEVEDLSDEEIKFEKEIELRNVSFSYIEGKEILNNINLTIKKGEKIALTGESGSGKSTLVDIIIGLYRPSKGEVHIDRKILNERNVKSWRKKIGYIPQTIYLFDGTVAQNIALGEEVDEKKMVEVLKKANIWDFLKEHHQGLETKVGEGGIKLSGGQKQRIAIARALYSDPEVLVLDEATSALDNETEAKIMDEIYKVSEDKTLIIIAHRLSTLDNCQKIYVLKNGKIEKIIKSSSFMRGE